MARVISPLLPGLREALGAAGIAMAATFLAFGAAVQEAGLSPGWALLACWGIYGMPGQLVLVQAATLGWAGGVGAALPHTEQPRTWFDPRLITDTAGYRSDDALGRPAPQPDAVAVPQAADGERSAA